MFRTEAQRAAVCETLCAWMGKGTMWTAEDPTPLARANRTRCAWSSGERLMLKLAWSFWNDSNKGPRVEELLHGLDPKRLTLVGTLLVAMGAPDGVAIWLDAHEPQR